MRIGSALGAVCVAAAALSGAAAASVADYDAGIFTISHDDSVWTIATGKGGDFSIACAPQACDGAAVGCSGSRLWVPLASVARLTRDFGTKATGRTAIDNLIRERAARAKANTVPDAQDVPPEVVKPYTLRHGRDGHPFYAAEYRASLGGRVIRFPSFLTAARSHAIAIVCHVPERSLPVWRPRIDALVEGFRPVPDPFWLRWLSYLGL